MFAPSLRLLLIPFFIFLADAIARRTTHIIQQPRQWQNVTLVPRNYSSLHVMSAKLRAYMCKQYSTEEFFLFHLLWKEDGEKNSPLLFSRLIQSPFAANAFAFLLLLLLWFQSIEFFFSITWKRRGFFFLLHLKYTIYSIHRSYNAMS